MAAVEPSQQQQLYIEFYDFCRKGDAGRAAFYLKAGLSASWSNQRDRNRSLLMATAWKDSKEVCELLIAHHANVNYQDSEKLTALHICAKQNSIRVATQLLENSADPNLMAVNGITPLMICADLGHTQLGRLLIDSPNTRLDVQSNRGFTALMKAVFENSVDLALLLIRKGARLDLASKGGFTALHLCAQLNRLDLATEILGRKECISTNLINLPTLPEFKGNTAFTLAAVNGHAKMLQKLRDAGADIYHANRDGDNALSQVKRIRDAGAADELLTMMTAWYKEQPEPQRPPQPATLSAAVLAGDFKAAERLIAEGAQTTEPDVKMGRTPLMLAASKNSPELVGLLLKSRDVVASIDRPSDDGCRMTALHAAVQSGSEDCVRLLLGQGAGVGVRDSESSTPLHLCAELNASVVIVEQLLDKAGPSDLVARNKTGYTAIEVAAIRGSLDVLRLLLLRMFPGGVAVDLDALTRIRDLAQESRQPQAVDLVTEFIPSTSRDAAEQAIIKLFTAAMAKDTKLVKDLLQKSASASSKVSINAKCQREPGWTALMATAWNDDEATCRLLLDLGADPNVTDTKLGITALHIAVQQDSQRVAKLLLEQKSIDLNVTSKDQRTPLIRAAWLNHYTIGEMLLSKSANVNAQEQDGFSALHFCAQEGLVDFASLLIGHNADLELQTSDKKNSNTAFTLAAIKGNVEMLEMLANVGANIYHRSTRGDAMELVKKARHVKVDEVLLRLDRQRNVVWESAETSQAARTVSKAAEICTDATGTNSPQLPAIDSPQNLLNSSIIPPIRGLQYSMKSNPRGICIIINNYEFGNAEDFRKGSSNDVEELQKLFRDTLKFRVQVHQNLDACDIKAAMQSLASGDRHTKYDCFVAFIMSHGESNKVMGSDRNWVLLDDIFAMFEGCRSLEGKPKLFFVQACRRPASATSATAESNVDGRHLSRATSSDLLDRAISVGHQPSGALGNKLDFLYAYAITQGDYALRSPECGSLYIQTLCKVMSKNYTRTHLCNMLNIVRRELGRQPLDVQIKTEHWQGSVRFFNVSSETTQLQGEVWFSDVSEAPAEERSTRPC